MFPGINPEPIEPHIEMLRQTVLKEKLPRRPGGRRRCGPHRRHRRRWQLRGFAQMLCRPFALGPGAKEMAWRRGARLQHHRHGGPHRRQVRAQIDRVSHRLQVHCRPHDGTRNCDGRRGIRRTSDTPAICRSATALSTACLLANVMAEERKPLGQLVADLQREYGPHYYGRRDLHITEEMKQSAIQRARSDQTNHLGTIFHQKEGRARRNKVLPGRSRQRQRGGCRGCCFACPARSRCCGFILKRRRPNW